MPGPDWVRGAASTAGAAAARRTRAFLTAVYETQCDASKRSHAVWLYNRSATGAEDIATLSTELIAGAAVEATEVAA